MIISFEGRMGTGKTLTMSAFAYEEALTTGQRIFSNYHLNIPYTKIVPAEFVSIIESEELFNCIFLLDEAGIYMDARASSTKLNRLFTAFVMQTRKRGCDLYISTQHIDMLDKRLRRSVNIRVRPHFDKVTNFTRVNVKNLDTGEFSRKRLYGPDYFWLYDTTQILELPTKLKDVKF